MSEASEYDQQRFLDAWARLGRTPDGRTIYLHLQKIVEAIPTDSEAGALRENLGRRRLASEIRAAMSEAVRTQDPNIDERPVVFTFAKPATVGPRNRGARPRVGAWRSSAADARGPADAG
jgi:hypothetical protein